MSHVTWQQMYGSHQACLWLFFCYIMHIALTLPYLSLSKKLQSTNLLGSKHHTGHREYTTSRVLLSRNFKFPSLLQSVACLPTYACFSSLCRTCREWLFYDYFVQFLFFDCTGTSMTQSAVIVTSGFLVLLSGCCFHGIVGEIQKWPCSEVAICFNGKWHWRGNFCRTVCSGF